MTWWDRNPGSVGIDTQDSAGVRGHRQPPSHSTGSKLHGIPPVGTTTFVGSTPLRAVMWITDVRDRNPRWHPSWMQNAAGSNPALVLDRNRIIRDRCQKRASPAIPAWSPTAVLCRPIAA